MHELSATQCLRETRHESEIALIQNVPSGWEKWTKVIESHEKFFSWVSSLVYHFHPSITPLCLYSSFLPSFLSSSFYFFISRETWWTYIIGTLVNISWRVKKGKNKLNISFHRKQSHSVNGSRLERAIFFRRWNCWSYILFLCYHLYPFLFE